MPIIGQNVKVWVEHCSSGVMTTCTLFAGPDSPSPCSSLLSVDSSSELLLLDVLCELVEVVLVDGPCELVVDRICPPVVSPLLEPDWRGST